MRNIIFLLLVFFASCAEENTEVYPLYKINAEIKPEQNLFKAELSLNYVVDTLTDTVVFLLNKSIMVDNFYGRHLSEWIPEKYPENNNLYKLNVVFNPPLKAYEFVRINSAYTAPLDKIVEADSSTGEFQLNHKKYWYPVEINERYKFFALTFDTEKNIRVKENGRLIDGHWQVLTEKPTDKIDITFIQY